MTEKIPALRLRHDHTFSLDQLSLPAAFTIEAWVCPAYMDRAALLYPEKGYEGNVVRLKPGLYRNIAENQLPSLGSLDLPEDIEVVFFAEPDFQGAALAQREDLADVPEAHQKIGSVVVLDRSHSRQNHLVLFDEAGFKGNARLLVLPDHWQQPKPGDEDNATLELNTGNPAFGRHTAKPLTNVLSAWVPPGVALDVLSSDGRMTLRGDMSEFPAQILNIQPRRDTPLTGDIISYATDFKWNINSSWANFTGVANDWASLDWSRFRVPQGHALFLYENSNLEGRYTIVVDGCDDLKHLGWIPHSAIFASAPDGIAGVIARSGLSIEVDGVKAASTIDGEIVVAPGKPMPHTIGAWFPAEYCLIKDNGERIGANRELMHHTSLEGYTVTRYCGVLANPAGYGLTIDRQPSALLNAPDELRFGGNLLRADRWYHLAQSWDGKTMRWILDGQVVKENDLDGIQIENKNWIVGQGLRGAITQLRVWDQALPPEFVQKNRFPGVNSADYWKEGQMPNPILQPDLKGFTTFPDAVLIDATLPSSPEKTMLTQNMLRQVDAEHQQNMVAVNQEANLQKAQAVKKAQYKVAQAHEKARRDIHFKGINCLVFARGSTLISGKPSDDKPLGVSYAGGRINDLVIGDNMGTFFCAWEDEAGGHVGIISGNKMWGSYLGMSPALALAKVLADDHPMATGRGDGHVRTGLYWIGADGVIKKAWGYNDSSGFYMDPHVPLQEVTDQDKSVGAFFGQPLTWDLVVGHVKITEGTKCSTTLYWTNGREIYAGLDRFEVSKDSEGNLQLGDFQLVDIQNQYFNCAVFVPNAASPNPIAIDALVMEHETQLVWLDAKDEVVRVMTAGNDTTYTDWVQPIDLYPAFNPGRGISICKIPNPDNPTEQDTYIYWVAGERKTWEVAVLDTRGRYFDLFDNLSGGISCKQHIDIVEAEDIIGTEWTEESSSFSSDLPSVLGKVLSFKNSDDHIAFSPIQLNLNQGWTVSAHLIWEPPSESDSMCIYELATFEGEDRLVCAIHFAGFPVLYLRWKGQETFPVLDPKALMEKGKAYRISWVLDSAGKFQTYIDDQLSTSGQFDFKPEARVFESQRLGAPCEFQDHHVLPKALMGWNTADTQHFDGFVGKINRFTAWNAYVPEAIHGVEGTPEADPSWDRSLVTVESRRRYLRAGRLDGQEPPVTLFPIDMDGGLSVESDLEYAHAQHTLAQNQLAAAVQYEAHRKAEALQHAQAKLSSAQQSYDAGHTQANADLAAAQAAADTDIAAAKQVKADADAKAARDKSDGKEKADASKNNAEQQYNDQVNVAANDKENRIAAANRTLSAQKAERDNVQWEYDEKNRNC